MNGLNELLTVVLGILFLYVLYKLRTPFLVICAVALAAFLAVGIWMAPVGRDAGKHAGR